MKYDYGIRVDLGGTVGSGHIFRCLALASELSNMGKEVIFLVNNEDAFVKHDTLNFPYVSLTGKRSSDLIKQCSNNLKFFDVLITDLPFQNEYYSKFFSGKCKTVIIDDLGNIKLYSTLLFNGSIVQNYHNYELIKNFTKTFFGPKYMILRKNFLEKKQKYRISKNAIKNILLTFGGSDNLSLTKKIVTILVKEDYQVTAILGHSFNDIRFSDFAKNFKNLIVKSNVQDMGQVLLNQDLAISAAGVTTYELATMGIPSILIPSDKYQSMTALEFSKLGFGINYGYWDKDEKRLLRFIHKLDNYDTRCNFFRKGRKLVDGSGVLRVARIISNNMKKG